MFLIESGSKADGVTETIVAVEESNDGLGSANVYTEIHNMIVT